MPQNIFSIWKALLLVAILALTSLFWLNSHVGYQAKSAILVKGSDATANVILAETITAFADTETFIDRTLNSTRLKESAVGQLSMQEQQVLIEDVEVKNKQGAIITVTAKNTDSEVSELIATESTETLLRMSRLYMGNEKELSLIVIDQAILTKTLVEPGLFMVRVVLSTAVLSLFLFVIDILLKLFRKKSGFSKSAFSFPKLRLFGKEKIAEQVPSSDERFVPQKLDPTFLYPEMETPFETVTHTQPKAAELLKGEVYGEAPENPLQSVSVSMDDLPFTFETPDEESEHTQEEIFVEEAPEREPTVVEYKQRLNELLSQK